MPSLQEKIYKFYSSSQEENERLDIFLHNKLKDKFSRSKIKEFIENGAVKLNNDICLKPSFKVKHGDFIEVRVSFEKEELIKAQPLKIEIIYQDEDLIVVNKPAGMLTHPTKNKRKDTLVNALLYYFPEISSIDKVKPGIVHRLDKGTSGVLVVGRNYEACAKLSREFKKRNVIKKYLAIVKGKVEYEEGVIDEPVGRTKYSRKRMTIDYEKGRSAITYYKVIERLRDCSFVLLYPKTGRTHQIRIHMKYMGHSIIGDRVYGKRSNLINRSALHAYFIKIKHPTKNKLMEFKAKIPDDFRKLLEEIGFTPLEIKDEECAF
jgi:23S rRNA pseudouridine1911/1915/1917 synthase